MATIWTIGHSTHSFEEFVAMLNSFRVECLVDIRSFPGSRRYPHFNKEALQSSLPLENIDYIHLPGLGGRRKAKSDSKNSAWHNASFRGYADYMETEEFEKAVNELEKIANEKNCFVIYRLHYITSKQIWMIRL